MSNVQEINSAYNVLYEYFNRQVHSRSCLQIRGTCFHTIDRKRSFKAQIIYH
jgi:hypothetical protein